MAIRHRLAFILIFLLILAAEPSAQETCYTLLDSISGKAELQKAGTSSWIPAEKGARLYDNDILRVSGNSRARLIWKDSSVMFVQENSQVLINLFENPSHDLITRHATVFFGAVFFIIKEILPKGMMTRCDTKIYTPTAALSIRGTSFGVNVDNSNGTTSVQVINGTVQVGNILKNQYVLTSAGYSTVVSMNAEPLQPRAVLTEDIEALKKWVPPKVIETEMNNQIAKSTKDKSNMTAEKNADTKVKTDIVIFPLENKTSYEGTWTISTSLSSLIAENLKKSTNNITVATADADDSDPIAYAESKNASYAITGQIITFEVIQKSVISVDAEEYSEQCLATTAVFVELIDVKNQKVLISHLFEGESSGANIPKNTLKEIAALEFNMKDKKFASTLLGEAITGAINQTTGELQRYMQFK
jgi:hypothetical protein